MSFDRYPGSDGTHPLSVPSADELPYDPIETLGGNVVVHVSPAALVGPVLGRLARAVAANSGFSVARFQDLYPVADALADHANRAADGSLSFAIRRVALDLDLVAGPFNRLPEESRASSGSSTGSRSRRARSRASPPDARRRRAPRCTTGRRWVDVSVRLLDGA